MKALPLIAGAIALAPVLGAFAGQRIGTDPIRSATDLSTVLPKQSPFPGGNAAPRTTPRLPDHYAMETPEGRVEVHELAMRGRYRDSYAPLETWRPSVDENLALMEARWDGEALDARAARALAPQEQAGSGQQARTVAHYDALEQARTGEATVRTSDAQTPLGKVPIAQQQVGNARIIDVQAALSAQR